MKKSDFNPEDTVRSLLFTIANDIGQIACLYALRHNLKRIYFGGYFLRNHPLSMQSISYSIRFWSKGEVEALFLRHEGYLGAIGAFLKSTEELDFTKYSWQENYANSSGILGQQNLSPCFSGGESKILCTFPYRYLNRYSFMGFVLVQS